jgi:hypothetical protein
VLFEEDTFDAEFDKLFGGRLTTDAIGKGGPLREGSRAVHSDYVSQFFGYLIHECDFAPEKASLAHFMVVSAIENFLESKRQNKLGEKVLPPHDVKSLICFDQIIAHIAQDLSFRDKLAPIPGLLTEKQAAHIQQNWRRFAIIASDAVQKLYEKEIGQAKMRFDNEQPIVDILESKEPMKILHDMRRAAMRAVDRAPTKFERAECLRDLFIIAVMILFCLFRPKTVCHLDWNPEERGSSFKRTYRDGKLEWLVFAEKEFFKNHNKPMLQNDYLRMIKNIDGLYDYLAEYVFDGRQILLNGSVSNCLVVNTSANPRFNPNGYGNHVRYLTRRLLTIDLRGKYPGVKSLTCTQARKIVATSLDYKYKDPHYTEVKNALMNEMPTVYRHKSARDRSRAMEDHIAETADA